MTEKPSLSPVVFSCSGASDVGALADRAARRMVCDGTARMACLAAIGARVPTTLQTAREAPRVLAIDGCANTCARRILEDAGFADFAHLRLDAMGLKKGETPMRDETVAMVAADGANRVS